MGPRRDRRCWLNTGRGNGLIRAVVAGLSLAFWGLVVPSVGAAPAGCPAAVQSRADGALTTLDKRQKAEDEQLRAHPTASYGTMNGPVLREMEKRQQRETLEDQLQANATKERHCLLQFP